MSLTDFDPELAEIIAAVPGHVPVDAVANDRDRGQRAVAEARAVGLELDPLTDDELISLGHAANEADLARGLEQARAENNALRQAIKERKVQPPTCGCYGCQRQEQGP